MTSLAPCPDTPNCVSSVDANTDRRVAPLVFDGPPGAALERLKRVVAAMPRTRIVAEQPAYLHAEFRSRLLGFVDDVEFELDAGGGVIQVRSASRTGRWDLGINRRRVEDIRERFRLAGGERAR